MSLEKSEYTLTLPESGISMDLLDPKSEDIDINDIVLGLSNSPRYTGQTDPTVNVAQHSVYTSQLVENEGYGAEIQMYALLHDAGEAYIGDIPRPVRKLMNSTEGTQFDRIENRILDTLWDSIELEEPSEEEWSVVMAADDKVLLYELDSLFHEPERTRAMESVYNEE